MERRYTVISADSHCGADVADYRPYLASRFHDEFDAWAATYEVPFADLLAPIRYRNWDSDRRMAEHEADGIVAEVLFPNTVPPFFEEGNLVALPPGEADYERRWAGSRPTTGGWPTSAPPHRAGGPGWSRSSSTGWTTPWPRSRGRPSTSDLFGGILLPSIPPGSPLPPLYDPVLRPLWRLCEEVGRRDQRARRFGAPRLRRTRRSPGPSCWWRSRGSATGPCGTSSSAASSSGSRTSRWPSPSRVWPGSPGASRPSTGSTAAWPAEAPPRPCSSAPRPRGCP